MQPAPIPFAATPPSAAPWADEAVWDGHSTYHWRAGDGTAAFSLWVPPGATPVRGLFINGHGGRSGDNRKFTRDVAFRAYAARHRFAVAGLHLFPGREVRTAGAARLAGGLAQCAALGPHAELAHLPWLPFGNSNGAATAYGLAAAFPERTIAFAMNVGNLVDPAGPDDAVLSVPGLAVVGPHDAILTGCEERMRIAMATARARGAHWAWLSEEGKGHADGLSMEVFIAFFEDVITHRLPAGASSLEVPVRLLPLDASSSRLVRLAPGTGRFRLEDTALAAGPARFDPVWHWLPGERSLAVFVALALHAPPFVLSIDGRPRPETPYNSPTDFMTVGGTVVAPGETLNLRLAAPELAGWSALELRDGPRTVRVFRPGEPLETEFAADGSAGVHTFLAFATLANGSLAASRPRHIVVAGPETLGTLVASHENQPPGGKAPREEPMGSGAAAGAAAPRRHPADLPVAALSASDESTLRASGAAARVWWEAPLASTAAIELVADTHPTRVRAAAARSRSGCYFGFVITDPAPAVGDDPARLHELDALDLIVALDEAATVQARPAGPDWVNQEWLIPLLARQVQCNARVPPGGGWLRVNAAAPHEFRFFTVTEDDAAAHCGIVVVRKARTEQQHFVQLFLPWSQVGAGLGGEPPAGTRWAFALRYADADAAGRRRATLGLEGLGNPWAVPATVAPAQRPRCYADLVLQPALPTAPQV